MSGLVGKGGREISARSSFGRSSKSQPALVGMALLRSTFDRLQTPSFDFEATEAFRSASQRASPRRVDLPGSCHRSALACLFCL
eukprot:1951144-Pyramimonas_sp.AAC.1